MICSVGLIIIELYFNIYYIFLVVKTLKWIKYFQTEKFVPKSCNKSKLIVILYWYILLVILWYVIIYLIHTSSFKI